MKNILSNLFTFDKMISEQIIKLVYYIGLLALGVWFVVSFFGSLFNGHFGMALLAPIALILGVVLWRVYCEFIIIIFRIYGRLGDINVALGGTNKEEPIPGDEALMAARDAAKKASAKVSASVKDVAEDTKNAASKATSAVREKTGKAAETVKAKAADLKPGDGEIEIIPPKKPAPKTASKSAAKTTTVKAKTSPKKKAAPKTTAAKKTAAKKTPPKKS